MPPFARSPWKKISWERLLQRPILFSGKYDPRWSKEKPWEPTNKSRRPTEV